MKIAVEYRELDNLIKNLGFYATYTDEKIRIRNKETNEILGEISYDRRYW